MSNPIKDIKSFLKIVSNLVSDLNDEQYSKLISGDAKLVYKEVVKAKTKKTANNELVMEYFNKIKKMKTREEAYSLFSKAKLNKNNLVHLANEFQVHTLKNDTRDKIIEKIVESVIGVKLRTEAIRESDLKGENQKK